MDNHSLYLRCKRGLTSSDITYIFHTIYFSIITTPLRSPMSQGVSWVAPLWLSFPSFSLFLYPSGDVLFLFHFLLRQSSSLSSFAASSSPPVLFVASLSPPSGFCQVGSFPIHPHHLPNNCLYDRGLRLTKNRSLSITLTCTRVFHNLHGLSVKQDLLYILILFKFSQYRCIPVCREEEMSGGGGIR